eukprot:724342-Rhodomonas_salina.3
MKKPACCWLRTLCLRAGERRLLPRLRNCALLQFAHPKDQTTPDLWTLWLFAVFSAANIRRRHPHGDGAVRLRGQEDALRESAHTLSAENPTAVH